MPSSAFTCARCGWHNEPTARMCGGCGQPLARAAMTPEDAAEVTLPEGAWFPASAAMPAPDFLAGQGAAWSRPGTVPPPGPAPRGVAPRQQRTHRLRRALLAALLVCGVVVLAGVVGWGAIVRPMVHRRVDATVRAELSAVAGQVPILPPGRYAIAAVSLQSALHASAAPGSPGRSAVVFFGGNRIVVTYTIRGIAGSAATTLTTSAGRLVPENTQVRGVLGLVESGSELQAAIARACEQLPSADNFAHATANNGEFVITIR